MSAPVKPELVFDRAEYAQRVTRTQTRMREQGIDVLVVADPANMDWLTGFDNRSFYTPQAVVVGVDAAEPLLVARHVERAVAEWSVYLDPANVVLYPERYILDSRLHPFQFVAQVLADRHGTSVTVGVELDAICYTPRAHEELQRALPDARFVDAFLLVNWLRTVKSPAEIAVMREAAAIADSAMARVTGAISVGTRECDAAAELFHALIRGTDAYGGSTPIRPNMPNGAKTSAPHLSWTDAPYQPDTATNIELGGSRHQYHAGFSRTVYLGTPPDRLRRLATTTHQGYEAALATVRPGATCHDVAMAWNHVIASAGYEKESRIGYSIGLGYPPAAWIEQTASLAEGDETVLVENMTFHFIIGMWMDDWGYVFSETVAVTADGGESLARFPRQLIVK
jgi:ectoine hydrolase